MLLKSNAQFAEHTVCSPLLQVLKQAEQQYLLLKDAGVHGNSMRV